MAELTLREALGKLDDDVTLGYVTRLRILVEEGGRPISESVFSICPALSMLQEILDRACAKQDLNTKMYCYGALGALGHLASMLETHELEEATV